MKKIVYAIAALALIFTGCAKELDNSTKENFSKVRLHVKVADQLTKVSADNDGRYHWQAGDKITVLNSKGDANEFSTVDGGASVNFSTDSFDGDAIGKYAMYPASAGHVEVEDVIGFNLPSSYIWKANSTNMPMLAKIVGDEATFKAVGGVLKLVCYNIPADAVMMEFSATNKQISGNFEIANGAVETPIIVTAAKESSNNLVSFDFTGHREDNMVFYIPLPTGTIDGFTVSFLSDVPEVVFTKTSTKSLSVSRNQMIIAPALNCDGDIVLWSENFNDFSTGLHSGLGYGGADITYTTNDSGTKTYDADNAAGTKPELLIKANKYFKVEGIPTAGESSVVLKYKTNAKALNLSTTTDGVTISPASSSTKAEHTSTITNSKGASTFDLIFTAGGDNVRIDDISVRIAGEPISAPTITATDDALEISVGSLTATTTVSLSNPVDALGISCVVNEEAKLWLSASISGTTLTVTAAEANSTAADLDGTVTLKATGAANVVITVTQPTKKVANPSVTATAGDAKFTASWAGVPHATSYVAYLHTASTPTPSSGGTDISSSIEESAGSYSITDYAVTNDVHYYLYIKVNGVESNYEAVTEYVCKDFTPEEEKGTAENPYWAEEFYDLVATYASGKGPTGTFYIKGYVSTANDPTSNYQTYYISNDGTTTKQFQAYRGKGISGANITAANRVYVGDYVVVSGTAINYSGNTPEFEAGSRIITHMPKLSAPTFSVAEGTYYSAQSVTLSAGAGTTIYYTTDGSTPTLSSSTYSAALSISSTTTVKAFAVKDGSLDSEVSSATYTIEDPTQLVMTSVTCTAQTHNSLTFTWTEVAHATGYQVSLDEGSSWETKQDGLSYTWTGLSASTTYTIKVKAIGTANGQYLDSDSESANGTTSTALTLTSIEITTPPTTTLFKVNGTFSFAGAVVTATYSDSSTANVTSSCTTDGASLMSSVGSNKTVTVTYTEGGVTKTDTYTIDVKVMYILDNDAIVGANTTWGYSDTDKSFTASDSSVWTANYTYRQSKAQPTIQMKSSAGSYILTPDVGGGHHISHITVELVNAQNGTGTGTRACNLVSSDGESTIASSVAASSLIAGYDVSGSHRQIRIAPSTNNATYVKSVTIVVD